MKKILALLLALAMVFALVACGSSDSDSSSEEEAAAETEEAAEEEEAEEEEAPAEEEAEESADEDEYKVFVYGTDANSTTFDPASELQTNSGSMLVHSVGEALWHVEEDGTVTMRVADSYSYDEDYLVITVKQGIQFSNGDDLDAEDVLATLKHCASQERTASMYAAMDLDNAEITDEYTLTIPMNNYDAALIDVLGNANNLVMDSEVITDDYDYSWLIGTGPYKLQGDGITDTSGWEESVQYTLVRNEYYWGDEPYYDEIIIKFYSEESTRYAEFQAGNLDAVYLTEATYINNLGNGAVAGASLIQSEENAASGFEMAASEETNGSMSDINVRKAFAHCIDIQAIVEELGEGIYVIPDCIVGDTSWAFVNTGIYEYDPEYAAECLAEAGYSVDNPLTINVYAEATGWTQAVFEAAQAYCAAIGINLDLSGLADFSTILPVLLAGDQDMTYGSASSGSGNDPANLMQQFGPLSDNVLIRVTDPDIVDIWNQAASSQDQAEREELYQEFIQYIHDEYLFVPVCMAVKSYGVLDTHSSFASCIDSSSTLDPTLLTD